MKHAFIVLAHKDISHLSALIQCLRERADLYIHLDKKMDKMDKAYIFSFIGNGVFIFSWRHVRWGSIQITKTELQLVREALKSNKYEYIHLISGQDYPIKDFSLLNSFLCSNKGAQFMEYHSLPIDKWEGGTFARFQYFRLLDWFDYPNEKGKRIIDFITGFQIKYGLRRRIPDQYPCLYGGSNWMSLTRECWEHIARDDRRSKKFLNRLRFTFASDEVYFHTLVMNSPFKSDVINNNLRLIKWRGGAVKVLNQLDIWDILTSQAFFARKFDSKYSKVLLDALAHFEKISYASHFNITFSFQHYICKKNIVAFKSCKA